MTPEAVREQFITRNRGLLSTTVAHLDAASDSLTFPADRAAVVTAIEASLESEEVRESLVKALVDAMEATGATVPTKPVPSPPYLTLTGEGVILRATTTHQGRAVVLIRGFDRISEGYVPVRTELPRRVDVTVQ